MSGSGSPPPAPDYTGAAREQGRWNLEAARTGAQLNRVNQVGPGGSTIYSRDGDQYTQTTTLSPEQRALYDAETGNAINRAGYAGEAGGRLAETLANRFSLNGLPSRVSSIDTSPYRSDVNASSGRYDDINTSSLPAYGDRSFQQSVDLSGAPSRADAAYQRSVDFSGAEDIPGRGDFSSERQRVEDSLYGRATSRLDDQFGRREEGVRSQLMNQGIREGSEAWNNAMRDFGNERQDAYGDARDRAIMAGGAEQSRLFADALRARQQGVGEALSSGDFVNRAATSANQYGLAARDQGIGEAFRSGEFSNIYGMQDRAMDASERSLAFGEAERAARFGNEAAQQRFSNEVARTSLYNNAAGAEFDQNLVNAGLTNSARDAGINEQMIPRNQAMNEYMSLYGYGGAPASPGVPGVAGPQPADYQGAANQLYGYQTDVYNANQARRAQNWQTGINLATTLAMLSDRRAKHDICHVGELPNGIRTYRFKYNGESQTRLGVMADEVAVVMPAAVSTGEDGFMRVNYAMIGGQHLLEAN